MSICTCWLCGIQRGAVKLVALGIAKDAYEGSRLISSVLEAPDDDPVAHDASPMLDLLAGPNAATIFKMLQIRKQK
jgi:hypothetical protein